MDSKSVTQRLSMSDEEYLKLKALKEKYNVSWDELIKYANRVLSEDMNKRDELGFSHWDVE